MDKPIMAKATAVWLVDNTTMSFKQIADFCGLHELEVQGIADGEVAQGVKDQRILVTGVIVVASRPLPGAFRPPVVDLDLGLPALLAQRRFQDGGWVSGHIAGERQASQDIMGFVRIVLQKIVPEPLDHLVQDQVRSG